MASGVVYFSRKRKEYLHNIAATLAAKEVIPLKHTATRCTALALALCCLLSGAALATSLETSNSTALCFSPSDFDDGELNGIVLTEVPSRTVGCLRYGSRTLQAGDVIPGDALGKLVFSPACVGEQTATVHYLPVRADGVGLEQAVEVLIRSEKNSAPAVRDSSIETYKNIAVNGKLDVSDPEGDKLAFTVTKEPKRGTVKLNADGTFSYTPKKNKVGEDSFRFTATDDAGNTSEEATVQVRILKPSSKQTYADMQDDAFLAVWMRENGLMAGEKVAGALCFRPDATVSRGEFLAMTMRLLEIPTEDAVETSGFADEADTAPWLRPYVISALRAGLISGVRTPDGLVFLPDVAITQAEACVILENALHLPVLTETAAMDTSVPDWALPAVAAMADADILPATGNTGAPLTRLVCAKMLYAVSKAAPASDYGLLTWAAE